MLERACGFLQSLQTVPCRSISPPCLGNRGQSDMCRADGGGKNRQTLMRLSFVVTLGNYGNETLMEKWQCGQEHVANSDKTAGNGVSI